MHPRIHGELGYVSGPRSRRLAGSRRRELGLPGPIRMSEHDESLSVENEIAPELTSVLTEMNIGTRRRSSALP